jgi:hypothetical protein
MNKREPSAADALWPHLAKALPEQQPRNNNQRGSIAGDMWPSLVPKPRDPRRDSLHRNLDALSAKLRSAKR